jgi:hypothetical protein
VKKPRIFNFETFINEGRKEKLEIDKTIKMMKFKLVFIGLCFIEE